MKFSETLSYPMSLDGLEAMSLDPEFLRSRFQRFTTGLEVVYFSYSCFTSFHPSC